MIQIRLDLITAGAASNRTLFLGEHGVLSETAREAEREAGLNPDRPFLRGRGGTDYLCGGCANVLLAHVRKHLVRDVVLRCPACGAYNDLA